MDGNAAGDHDVCFFREHKNFDACSTDRALAEEEEDHNDSLPLRFRLRYSRASRRTSWLRELLTASKPQSILYIMCTKTFGSFV